MRYLFAAAVAVFAADTSAQIPISKFVTTFQGNRVRGYHFQAPVNFIITKLEVPDEAKAGKQYVAVYKMTSAPPAYPSNRSEKAIFYKGDVPSGQQIRVIPPLFFKKGDWVGVLGCCATSATSIACQNSYGDANFPSRLAGTPVTLVRFITQTIIGMNSGNAPVSSSTGSTGRIITWIVGQGATEHFGTNTAGFFRSDPNPPSIGYTCEIDIMPHTATNQGGLWLIGLNRVNLPTPYGNLLVLPILLIGPVSGPIPLTGTAVRLPIPNDNRLLGVKIPLQAGIVAAPNIVLTNGAEIQIGR